MQVRALPWIRCRWLSQRLSGKFDIGEWLYVYFSIFWVSDRCFKTTPSIKGPVSSLCSHWCVVTSHMIFFFLRLWWDLWVQRASCLPWRQHIVAKNVQNKGFVVWKCLLRFVFICGKITGKHVQTSLQNSLMRFLQAIRCICLQLRCCKKWSKKTFLLLSQVEENSSRGLNLKRRWMYTMAAWVSQHVDVSDYSTSVCLSCKDNTSCQLSSTGLEASLSEPEQICDFRPGA